MDPAIEKDGRASADAIGNLDATITDLQMDAGEDLAETDLAL